MGDSAIPVDPVAEGQPPVGLTSEEKMWAMFCHLSALLAYFAAGMTFLGPLICWLMKKDTSKFVDENGKESLNFQLNILVYTLIGIATICLVVGFVIIPAVHVYSIVCVIIAAIKANQGEMFRYPFIFRLIK
jgi:uncharacterized protein